MLRWKRDVLVGILFEIFCIVCYIDSFKISVGTMGAYKAAQPGVYLRLWLIVFGVLSLAMIVNALRKKDTTVLPAMFQKQTVFTLVLLAAYIYFMKPLGFTVSTLIFSCIIILDYSWAAGKFLDEDGKVKSLKEAWKSVLFYVVISAVITVATEFLFGTVLNVTLP